VKALRHHADLQAHRHHKGSGADHDEPGQYLPSHAQAATASGPESSRIMVHLEDGATLLTCTFRAPVHYRRLLIALTPA
jgi:hypothetical protein